MSKNLTHLD